MAPERVLDQVGDGAPTEEDAVIKDQKTRAPRRKLPLPLLSVLGLASLCYLLGGAAVFFDLPSSGFLNKAFVAAQAWYDRQQTPGQSPSEASPRFTFGKIDKPGKTFDGFTLYTVAGETKAFLINMRGDVVHEWAVSFSKVWPQPPHLRFAVRDSMVIIFGCDLRPNGDLLVVFHGGSQTNPTNGYGLVKLDKDSNIVWKYPADAQHKYPANVHHDVDVGDDGTVYAITQEIIHEPPKGLEFLVMPSMVDHLVVLSPEGEELKKIPILEALRDSPYAPVLGSLDRSKKQNGTQPVRHLDVIRGDEGRKRDVLHTNFVDVLSHELAPKFPRFKPGQVLISMCHLDTIAVIDTETRSAVWAARGPWRGQHDSQFLDNGRLLIFDNLGSPKGSRVLEYDPETQAFPWSYSGEKGAPFLSSERGMGQRLPNGNTLIVNSEGGEMFEVTPDKEVVWSRSCRGFLQAARRYGTDQLHFLKGGERARP